MDIQTFCNHFSWPLLFSWDISKIAKFDQTRSLRPQFENFKWFLNKECFLKSQQILGCCLTYSGFFKLEKLNGVINFDQIWKHALLIKYFEISFAPITLGILLSFLKTWPVEGQWRNKVQKMNFSKKWRFCVTEISKFSHAIKSITFAKFYENWSGIFHSFLKNLDSSINKRIQ